MAVKKKETKTKDTTKDVGLEEFVKKYQRHIDPQPYDTGNYILNAVLGNGLPKNTFIELASESGVGKSTMALHICKSLCLQGKKVIYIDLEGGMENPLNISDQDYKKGNLLYCMGLEPFIEKGQFLLINATTKVNVVNEIITRAIERYDKDGLPIESDYALLVIDSIAALTTNSNMINKEGGIETQKMAEHAQIVSFLVKRLNTLKSFGTSYLFINQLRADVGSMYNTSHTTGGVALKYFCDIRLTLRRVRNILNGDYILGSWVRVIAEKNRVAKGNLPYELPILFGKGMSQILTVMAAMKNKHIINCKGESVPMYQEGSWKTITLGDKEEDTFKTQKETEVMLFVGQNLARIKEEGLITQDDFRIDPEAENKIGG